MQCPQRMIDIRRKSDLVKRLFFDHFDQRLNDIVIAIFQHQTLSMSAPEEIRRVQCGQQLFGVGSGQIQRFIRHHRAIVRRLRGEFFFRCCRIACSSVDNSIDSTMFLIAQICFVRVPFACFEANRSRIVLNDEVVPIDHPHITIGSNFGHDRAGPFIVAGQQVPRILRSETGPVFPDHKCGHNMAGRFGHESGSVPVFLRIITSRVKSVTCRSGESAVVVNLPNFAFFQWFEFIAVRDPTKNRR